MTAIDVLLGSILAHSRSRSRDFLGPPRVGQATHGDGHLRTPAGPRRGVASGLTAQLIRLRVVAERLSTSGSDSTARSSAGLSVSTSRLGTVKAEAVAGSTRGDRASFEVKVTRLARAQVNEGHALAASETNAIQAGTNTLTITVGTGPASVVSFANDSTDTNRNALEKLAEAINTAGTGVTASLVEDETAGTVWVLLTATATGLGAAFDVRDVSGNAVATSGVGAVTTQAQDARFFVEGVARTSGSNTVFIDHGRVRLTFEAESGPAGDDGEAGVVITVGPDPLSAALLELADSVNDLMGALDADGSASALRTRRTFEQLLTRSAPELESAGVMLGQSGRLVVDTERLEQALAGDRGTVERILATPEGVGSRLSAAAQGALGLWGGRAVGAALLASGGLPQGSPFICSSAGSRGGLLLDLLA